MTATLTIEVLTTEESKLFEVLHTQVANSLESAAIALAEIKEKKLYRGRFKTFEEYCNVELKRTPQHIRRMISTNEKMEQICSIPGIEGVELKRSHVAVIKDLPQEQQAEVIKNVASSGKKVTAEALRVAVQRVAPPKTAKVTDREDAFYGETLDVIALDEETVLCSTPQGKRSFMRGWVEFESAPVAAPRRQKQQIVDISNQADSARVGLLEGLISELLSDGESVVSDRMRDLFASAGVK